MAQMWRDLGVKLKAFRKAFNVRNNHWTKGDEVRVEIEVLQQSLSFLGRQERDSMPLAASSLERWRKGIMCPIAKNGNMAM
ncbi:hypothetical protein Pyn_33133 [Prunus yedoensis var. nudiflora]|uniref:Uncharacterized protein n=1 Tax=Prunus yedoensis var. nudiflora TaxID=2094558 RepID=A0A314ZB64_PRUYE|nr:hypothetical protein Pyn_33133 [Prunus yedoensis var. nudiflora]